MPIRIRRAIPADRPRIAALREAAGWNVRAWVLDVFTPPAGAAWVATDGDAAVGCGSGIVHGSIGIVGNMIVAETHRRRGIGTQILARVLDFLRPRATTIELNATADGRPLYERVGFAPVVRYHGAELDPAIAATDREIRIVPVTDAVPLADWDAARFGGSRRRLLDAAVRDAARDVLAATRDGALTGFAVVRPAEAAIGPWVADDAAAAAVLLAAAGEAAPGVPRWRITIPGDNQRAIAWLGERGVELEAHGLQMRIGPPPSRRLETIWATGAGAVG